MTQLIIPLSRLEGPTDTSDTEPTPVEIQRWEDDGGAVFSAQQRAQGHCSADHRQRAAA